MDPAAALAGRRGVLLALARIVLGLIFLETWFENLHKGLYGASGYAHFVTNYADRTVTPGFGAFLDHVVIPHAAVFSKAQMVTELLLIAIPLLLGLFTPVAGLIGAGFAVNLLLANAGVEWYGTYVLLLLSLLVVALGQSGRTWGVDACLVQRRPRPRLPVY